MRVAVYYAPARSDPLWAAGAAWLGRDPESAARLAQPGLPGIEAATAEARRYGFHATLKPPMRLARGWSAFLDDAAGFAATRAPFALPALQVAELSGFLALRETVPCPALHALADGCVRSLDAHRVPPDAADLARRRGGGLAPEREANLLRWGYPDVLGTWRFHMTLTRRIGAAELPSWHAAAASHFAEAAPAQRRVDAICLFTQADPAADFLLAERLPLRG